MAARKKKERVVSKRERSKAAKKGWQTRKRNELLKKQAIASPELVGIELQEAKKRITELEEYIEQRTIKVRVDEAIKAGLIKNDPDTVIRARLRIAIAEDRMDLEAYELADEYPEYGVGEIFTIGFSP